MSGPHDFAVRATHHSSVDGFASIASSPPFVTIAKRPSVGWTARTLPVIWGGDQLRQIGTTGKSPGTFRQFVKASSLLRGAKATKQSRIVSRNDWIASLALAMTVGCAGKSLRPLKTGADAHDTGPCAVEAVLAGVVDRHVGRRAFADRYPFQTGRSSQ